MKLKEIKEVQPNVFQRFEGILSQQKLHHAYLFTGNFASFEMAQLLAQSLFCKEKEGVWACGTCRSCRLIAEEDFSDVTVLRPVNQIIKTERVRELVRNFAQSGLEGKEQVFIICDADKMHLNAANSLLKVIEEPQSEVYIFLLTSDEELILPTIKSRAQVFSFPKNQAYLAEKLERAGLVKNQAELLATFSQTLAEAERLTTSASFFDLARECQRFVTFCLNQPNQAYLQVAKLASLADDKEKQETLFRLAEIYLAEEMTNSLARTYLERLFQAQKMWQANVSCQNALEYMVLQED